MHKLKIEQEILIELVMLMFKQHGIVQIICCGKYGLEVSGLGKKGFLQGTGARTELGADCIDTARKLITRALQEVPMKMRPTVLLDKSRLEEYAGNIDAARKILANARKESTHEWKV